MFSSRFVVQSFCILLLSLSSSFAQSTDTIPQIVDVHPVDRDLIAVTVHDRKVIQGGQQPYVAKPDDKRVNWQHHFWVNRDGRDFAALVGKDQKIIDVCQTVVGQKLDVTKVANPQQLEIQVKLPAGKTQTLHPIKVSRKSEPLDFVRTALHDYDSTMTHDLYLQLPDKLVEGASYTITFSEHVPAIKPITYVHQSRQNTSPAVHVTQVGFKPGDPKMGYLSMWLGDGGGYGYQVSRSFEILDHATGKSVFQGKIALSKAADDASEDYAKRNYNGTDVYIADFSIFKTAGVYRLYIDGVGCSMSFAIDEHVWDSPFITAARGLYHQRSGIALTQPFTDFKRPRPHHPADGVIIHQSGLMYMDPRSKNDQASRFKDLAAMDNGKTTDTAWGGYMDAGDWDRRVDHLRVSHLLFELIESYPDTLGDVKLNIPESNNNLPDLLDEALFNLDFYRRMQRPDGAVSGGIEAEEHPRYGEASWQDSLRQYQFAPGPYATFTYAACAAHASIVLESHDSTLAKMYLDSARKAMDWAVNEVNTGKYKAVEVPIRDAWNLASLMLYRKTHEPVWHEQFKQTTIFKSTRWHIAQWQQFDQTDAAYFYLTLPKDMTDSSIEKFVRQAFFATAKRMVDAGRATAFGWGGDPGAGVGWGKLTVPQAINQLRAYRLTGERMYYDSTIHAVQFGTGANPSNLCYTTGVGHRWPTGVLNVDAMRSKQSAPKGLTLMGPMDVTKLKGYWTFKFASPFIYPDWSTWPTTQAFWEVPIMARTNEYTVHKTLGPNVYVWGCLAGMTR